MISLLNLYIDNKISLLVLLFAGGLGAALITFIIKKKGEKYGKYEVCYFSQNSILWRIYSAFSFHNLVQGLTLTHKFFRRDNES
jgi:hypothetical protein